MDERLVRLSRATPQAPVPLGGYDVVGLLGRGGMGSVYEAIDRERGVRVALKTLQVADAAAAVRLKREFRVVADLAHPNLVPVYELVWADGLCFFVMERVEGVGFAIWARGAQEAPVSHWLPETSTLDTVSGGAPARPPTPWAARMAAKSSPPARGFAEIRAAVSQLVRGVAALHDAGLRHGDLKPSNVLVRPDGRVVIVDFGLTGPVALGGSSGTPVYMAPELLARRGAEVGPWSDWYALGVMLYEALTGWPPYTLCGSIGLLCAKSFSQPLAPRRLVPEVPVDLSDACVELLHPSIHERPGAAELLRLLDGDEAARRHLARRPARPLFVGRWGELRQLEQAYGRAQAGRCTVVHVHGPSGIGKSAVVRCFLGGVGDLDDTLVLRGRCYERESVPYKAFDGVLDELAGWLHAQGTEVLSSLLPRWAGELAQAFPALAAVPFFREAAAALGPPPDAPELRRRTFVALDDLLERLGRRRTVIVAIDDLQWTDGDSAELLGWLVGEAASRGAPGALLVVASYRSTEAAASAPLAGYFELCGRLASAESGALVDLAVGALAPDDAEALARERLRGLGLDEAEGRAARLAGEAGGVPFFVEELARFAGDRGPGAPAAELSLDEALAARVASLPPTQRRLLEVVAVAGRPVPQSLVFEAAGLDASALPELLALCSASLLDRTGASAESPVSAYHDRIRESALGAIGDEALPRLHLALGRVFAARCGPGRPAPQAGEPWLFDAVDHLGAASSLVLDPAERVDAARLHLAAGRWARRAAAFPLALRCFEGARAFWPEGAWADHHGLLREQCVAAAECAWLVGSFALAEQRLAEVHASARGTLDRVDAWRVGIAARIARRDLLGAIALAREGLDALGVALPSAPTDADVGAAVQRAMASLGDRGAERLAALPDVAEPDAQAVMDLLVDVTSAAYYAMPALVPIIACQLVVSSLDKGPSAATPFGLAIYGLVLNAIGLLPQAHEIGLLARRMIARWEDRRLEVRTRLVVHNNVCSWTVPLQSTLTDLLETYRLGRATGDFEFAAIAAQCWATSSFVGGVPLAEVERVAGELGEFMQAHQQNTALALHRPLQRLVGALRGRTAAPASLSYEGFDEEETLATTASASVAFVTLSDMLVARYHFGDPREAWAVAQRARPFQGGAASTHHLSTFHLYAPLAAARLVAGSPPGQAAELLAAIDASLAQLEAWSAAGPANFRHRLLLVRAERARAAGDAAAASLFLDALWAACQTEYVNDEALSAELAGRFFLSCGGPRSDEGRALIDQARRLYDRWGASAKVRRLDDEFARG